MSYKSFTPANNTSSVIFNCDDINSVLIEAIIQLAENGSSVTSINNKVTELCPQYTYTDDEMQTLLQSKVKLGLLSYAGFNPYLFKVNGDMGLQNPILAKYWRPLGQLYTSFYTC